MKFIFSTISRNRIFSFLVAVICFFSVYFIEQSNSDNHSSALSSFESVLHEKEAIVQREMDSILLNIEKVSFEKLFADKIEHYSRLYEKEGIVLLVYEHDSLKFWTDQSVAVENYLKEVCLDDRLVQLKNGWFEVYKKYSQPKGTRGVYGLILLKKEYAFENNYLVNEFQKDFTVSKNAKILKTISNVSYQVKSSDGSYLCSLWFEPDVTEKPGKTALIVLLNAFGFLFSFLFVKNECRMFSRSLGIFVSSCLFIGTIMLLRFLTIKIHFPASFYEMELFSPKLYGNASSFWLQSLGDFLINMLLIFYSAYYFRKHFQVNKQTLNKAKIPREPLITAILLFIFFLSMMVNHLFAELINNSNISFNINNLFDLTIYSYIALFIIGLLIFTFFLTADKLIEVVRMTGISFRKQVFIFIICTILYVIISHLAGIRDLILILWSPAIIIAIVLIKKNPAKPVTFSGIVIFLLLVSLFSVHALLKFSGSKERENRKVYAEKLSVEQDPITEYLFSEIGDKIMRDTSLINILYQPYSTKEMLSRKLIQKYFGGYWEKYDVHISAFDTACFSILGNPNPERDNLSYFEEIVRKRGQPTTSTNLFYVDNPDGKTSYLARIKLYRGKKETIGELFIEFDSKFVSEEIGFPELLLDREIGLNRELSNYSYAKYKNDNLLNYHGKYPYSLTAAALPNSDDMFLFEDKGGYNHLLYRPDKNSVIILSKKNQGFIGEATTFSFLFTFFSLLVLLFRLLKIISTKFSVALLNFKNRIQYLLVFMVLISLGFLGGGTVFYISRQYESTNRRNINDKMISARVETRQELGQTEQLSQNSHEYLTYVMKRISTIFFTDINLYDTNGNLLASSRPKVFDEGLMSKKMCPESFYELAINKKMEFTHDEQIGNLNYLSAYIPFKNNNGKLLGYLNLPYFAKQSELEKEISSFLSALINIYVLLFALSVVAAVFISNYVTKPLKLIQDKMSKIKLGKNNEPIVWKEQDEIGSLVKEYNRMISELQKSAELLARSERESAWREMAKQVAHEIKNPLTPMKLSVQHLERLIHNKTPDIGRKITELSKTLIEQIETLSTIANEFSNFAKMPKANEEKINLQEILTSTIHLFKDSFDQNEMKFSSEVENDSFVFADKEQLLRVFNNLIKNAVQAVPENIQGKIEISLFKKNNSFVVKVKDNGTGISEEVMQKIFVPNFTTKTGGMGLGLAMVKNIMESCNGKIWFETAQGTGTTFFVSIPEYRER